LVYKIEFSEKAKKSIKKLDRQVQKKILDYIDEKICKNPYHKRLGIKLSYEKAGLWRYRVGDYRIICEINDKKITILVLDVGHRRDIYK
jgi:mRNA interferase RelE/StbE